MFDVLRSPGAWPSSGAFEDLLGGQNRPNRPAGACGRGSLGRGRRWPGSGLRKPAPLGGRADVPSGSRRFVDAQVIVREADRCVENLLYCGYRNQAGALPRVEQHSHPVPEVEGSSDRVVPPGAGWAATAAHPGKSAWPRAGSKTSPDLECPTDPAKSPHCCLARTRAHSDRQRVGLKPGASLPAGRTARSAKLLASFGQSVSSICCALSAAETAEYGESVCSQKGYRAAIRIQDRQQPWRPKL